MRWARFFRELPAVLREDLSAPLTELRWSSGNAQAKAWYGNPALHYEVWVRPRLRVVEIGLHFEADGLTNARLLAAFRARAREVTRRLGEGARIESWDRGWARVWEPISLEQADDVVRERVRTRLRDYVRELEPILREELPSDVEWRLGAAPERRAKVISSRGSRRGR